MDSATLLPHVNAALNAVSTVLIVLGFILIRRGAREAHRKVMLLAIGVSAVFLVSYLFYHFTAPIFVFPGTGPIRALYYVILITHVILAAVVTPMIILTALRALRGTFDRHKALARWTLPIWLYVTVTGVIIYWMLYHAYPGGAVG
jgi:uncharacterized membrane protein YozB (DUF420 family)